MKSSRLKITALLLLLCLYLPYPATTDAGTWKTHHAIGRQVARVIDGERYVYFMVHENPYDSGMEGNDEISLAAWRAEKSLATPQGVGITPLAGEYSLSGDAVLAEEYNPVKKYLCLLHTNGMIDLVYDSGRLETISAFADNPLPGRHTVGSITFSPPRNEIFLATDGGYIVMDDENLTLLHSQSSGSGIDWIGRVGDDIVTFTGGNAYISSAYPMSFTESALLRTEPSGPGSGLLADPHKLMPLSDRSFAFLTLKSGTADYALHIAMRDDKGKWHVREADTQTVVTLPATQRRHGVLESCGSPCRDGYFFFGQTDIFLLDGTTVPDFSHADPAGDYAIHAVKKMKKPTETASDQCGSWDFSTVWAYADLSGFYAVDASGAGTTVARSMPDAPLTTFCRRMIHNPAHGLLTVNRGIDYLFNTYGGDWGTMLSALKGNSWTNLSPSWHRPEGISDSDWKKAVNSYPVKNPNGIAVDPDNPDYVYVTSAFHGIARLNLSDISAPALHWSKAGDPTAVIPGFSEISPSNYLCWFGIPSFDEEGNLWVPYFNYGKFRNGDYLEMWMMPRGKRLALEDDAVQAAARKDVWTILPVKAAHTATNKLFNTLLHHPDNRKIMMISPILLAEPMAIYSAGEDVTDASDDVSILFNLPETTDGQAVSDIYVYSITEDPVTGRVWIGPTEGLFSVSPKDILEGKPSVAETMSVADGKGGPPRDPFEGCTVTSMAFDPQGRVWAGTFGDGLFCISADRKTLLGHFDKDNSGLADNRVTAVAWNATNGSVAVATLHGLSEYFPDGVASGTEIPVMVWPEVVKPDYFGWVCISGLPADEKIVILDSDGSETADLGSFPGGVAYWDPATGGRRVASGKYRVATARTHTPLAEIKVMN